MGRIRIIYGANNTFTAAGSGPFTVEAVGGGGAGGNGNTLTAGGGGGGGAYASSNLTLTNNSTHSVVVGQGGAVSGNAGGNSDFGSGPQVRASGGASGTNGTGLGNGTPGAGGAVNNSIGTTRTAGSSGSGQTGGSGAPPLGSATVGGGGTGGAALSQPGTAGAKGIVVVSFDYVSDTVSATDDRTILVNFKRSFNDQAFANDALAKKFFSPEADSIAALDNRVIKPILSRAETVSVQDALTRVLMKRSQENIVVSDSITVVLLFLRYFGDIATAADQLSKQLGASKSDSVAAVESVFKLFIKSATQESVTASDSILVTNTSFREFAEAVIASDNLFKKVSLSFSDNISGAVVAAPSGGRKIFIISD